MNIFQFSIKIWIFDFEWMKNMIFSFQWKFKRMKNVFHFFFQYKPGFMLFSLICYAIKVIICISVLYYMQIEKLYSIIVSLGVVSLFICAVFSYNFIRKSISYNTYAVRNQTNDRLSNVIHEYDIFNGNIENIMIRTIAWYFLMFSMQSKMKCIHTGTIEM